MGPLYFICPNGAGSSSHIGNVGRCGLANFPRKNRGIIFSASSISILSGTLLSYYLPFLIVQHVNVNSNVDVPYLTKELRHYTQVNVSASGVLLFLSLLWYKDPKMRMVISWVNAWIRMVCNIGVAHATFIVVGQSLQMVGHITLSISPYLKLLQLE